MPSDGRARHKVARTISDHGDRQIKYQLLQKRKIHGKLCEPLHPRRRAAC